MRTRAHLIDTLFANPRQAGILLNWTDANGAAHLIAQRMYESTSNVERGTRDLARSIQEFVSYFAIGDTPDLSRRGASQELIRDFATRNADFILDPSLPAILETRMSTP